ncbi:hypothetical protein R1flu_028732 [Riccia fluitans]|uniref:Uncharacterized protein n=1 Tax=Riccia fluitans TaxID=41844 RepID=A0ABD1XMJ9_9MARC
MGAKLAKPNPPADNLAKANADLAMDAMKMSANNFFAQIRLGTASEDSLGYTLTDQKLTDQEMQLIVQTKDNVMSDDIDSAIDSIFSGDWKSVAKFAAKEIIGFLGGGTPTPAEEAVNKEWHQSYLSWEYNTLLQYSTFILKTNAKSTGTLTEDTETTLMACICRGIVDYRSIDPEAIGFQLNKTTTDLTEEQFNALMKDVMSELENSAKISNLKRQLLAGGPLPEEIEPAKPKTETEEQSY